MKSNLENLVTWRVINENIFLEICFKNPGKKLCCSWKVGTHIVCIFKSSLVLCGYLDNLFKTIKSFESSLNLLQCKLCTAVFNKYETTT